MLAACHSNPFFKTNSLAELYQKVRSGGNLCVECDLSISSDKPRIGKNNISLNFTMDASIQLLEDSSPDTLNLLYFLGCLPGGMKLDQLKELWYGPDIEKGIEILDTMSLLQPDTDYKITLTPFLNKYIELSIAPNDKDKLIHIIAEHYMGILTDYYRVNSIANLNDE